MTTVHIGREEILELSREDWELIVRALEALNTGREEHAYLRALIRDLNSEILEGRS